MANVYHAVAGRVNKNGFHPSKPYASRHHDTASSGARDLRPEEILYRSKPKLLKKILEDESYFAHEKLPPSQPLPNSSILEAIHAYSADFYQSQTRKQGKYDHHTMDESALLAMGILVEELAKEEMGETGDMVLVEGQYSDNEEGEGWATDESTASRIPRKHRKRSRPTAVDGPMASNDSLQGVRKKFKRRRHKLTDANTD
ncbi:hypothetical protein N7495_006754 [Penicillium taxi]|uniref:uncharacterized protein n=1 Tax=Penicillium taxi TaxID=168475 RepID=UPI00254506C1|nr:uncharacterized protein N7495_006754 [Penicillium taxi]KAJ5895063.1 hypothetical protein N7495_006754 [Penicillium taxi]